VGVDEDDDVDGDGGVDEDVGDDGRPFAGAPVACLASFAEPVKMRTDVLFAKMSQDCPNSHHVNGAPLSFSHCRVPLAQMG